MDIENDKILEAFWCLFDSADEKNYSVLYYVDKIDVYENSTGGSSTVVISNDRIGKIEVFKVKEKLPRFWFESRKYKITYIVRVEVHNTDKGVDFYATIDGEKAIKLKDRILKLIQDSREKREIERYNALEEMLCAQK